jgi:hypothetical protein
LRRPSLCLQPDDSANLCVKKLGKATADPREASRVVLDQVPEWKDPGSALFPKNCNEGHGCERQNEDRGPTHPPQPDIGNAKYYCQNQTASYKEVEHPRATQPRHDCAADEPAMPQNRPEP